MYPSSRQGDCTPPGQLYPHTRSKNTTHDLVTTKTIYAPLETILTARAAKSDAKDPATKVLFDTYKKSADTLTFRGHRNAPVARVEWEDYYVFMKALVIEHPKLLLAENKGFNKTLSELYRSSSDLFHWKRLTYG
jgi:hypothetical protein